MNGKVINVAVLDAFEIRANTTGSDHKPGLVVVFDGRQCQYHLPALRETVELLRPDGSIAEFQVAEIKEHGEGRSFFFAGLTKQDAPIGSVMSWAVGAHDQSSSARHQAVG